MDRPRTDLETVGRLDVADRLPEERRELLTLLDGLDAAAWDLSTECPAWTVQGVALHVLGDDLSLLSRQRDEAANGLILYAQDHAGLGFQELLDGFNERWVTGAGFLSTRLITTLLALTGAETAAYYGSVDPGAPGEPVGFFGGRQAGVTTSPFWQAIAREYVERVVHQQQIRRAVGAPDLAPTLVVPAAEAVALGVAALLPPLDAVPGTTVVLAAVDLGVWTLERTGDDAWQLHRGRAAEPDAELRLDADDAVTAVTRGLTRAQAREALTEGASGDPTLVGVAATAVAELLRPS